MCNSYVRLLCSCKLNSCLLMPIDQLYFQISNCNAFVYVTLAYVFQVYIVTVLDCNVSCHRVSLKHISLALFLVNLFYNFLLIRSFTIGSGTFILPRWPLQTQIITAFYCEKKAWKYSARIWKYVCVRRLKMFSLTENVGKIISAHPYKRPAVNRINTVFSVQH